MVGIGLGIGLLLIIFVNSSKHDHTRSTTPPVAQAPTTAVPAYQPPHSPPITPRQKPAQEAVIQRSAATESVDVLGQQVMFSNPSGYCAPGKSVREVELMGLARRSLSEGSRLLHAAVRCSELEDYRGGRRDVLDHWLQIQLLGAKGSFQRIEMQREAFFSSPRTDDENSKNDIFCPVRLLSGCGRPAGRRADGGIHQTQRQGACPALGSRRLDDQRCGAAQAGQGVG